ncbi:MAG: TAXI family TRAP transporter solute-binding subunit [Actinomycetota bacterium]|nr:TAXI family TRAP transporter solute-binding subunit [Actinomycetota bacterium]
MTKKLLLTLAMAAFVSVGIACGAPQGSGDGGNGGGGDGGGGGEEDFVTDLQLGTGSVGGVYFPLGQEMATIFTDNIDTEGFNVSSVETGASVDNLAAIARGELQLGIAQNNTAQDAVAGEGEFEGAAVENAGWMGQLYPEAISIITLESTGIETIEDLEGQRVAIGPPGGATRAAAELVLTAAGLEEGDYEAFEEDFGTAQTRLQDGNLDASIEVVGVPSASISELQAVTGEVRLVPLDDDAIAEIEENSGYGEYEISADAYEFLDEPVPTASAFSTLFGSTTQVSEDLGYEITRTLYENADDITLAQSEFITVEDALLGQGDLPLHPGAERYFEEEGISQE